jgi:CHAT domain-containing protein/tetratricopeptide (TPR) repeat protein
LEHSYNAFLHGDLKQSQEEADRGYQQLRSSNPDLAWKFRVVEAKSLLWRGMYPQALALLSSLPALPNDKDSLIEILAIDGVAHARQHQFVQAVEELEQAMQICQTSSLAECGDVVAAYGVLAVQRGQIDSAKQLFAQSLQFARAHNDRFLEATALLNLGLTLLREEHFDEAIDWTDAAYQASLSLGAGTVATKAQGNLGWAYYCLGDSERSLESSRQAEKRADQVGDLIDQLSWITNIGYVYASHDDLAGAKQSYLKALDLANKTSGREDIYNALRALALVSVEQGNLEDARKYADSAFNIAHTDNNRLDELYPLLVKGLIAAKSHAGSEAERILHEVERGKNANPSLKWRSEHALAQLYEDEKRPHDADLEYRTALATFEAARSSLQRNDSRLPFFNNASRIYDDYVHFLVSNGKTDEALRWADYSRARTLTEGLGLLPKGGSPAPPPLHAQQIAQRANGAILFYWLGEKQSYLWTITPKKTGLFTLPPGAEIEATADRYGKALGGPGEVLKSADPNGRALYRILIAPAQSLLQSAITKNAKVFVIPDGKLNNLNFETLLVPERESPDKASPASAVTKPKLHYWIEDVTIANASSLRVLGASRSGADLQTKKPGTKKNRNLLLVGDSISPSHDKYPELPHATEQMENVARHFAPAKRRILTREQATPAAYLDSHPEQFSYIHFVAHGTASRLSPLNSAIVLSPIASPNTTPSTSAPAEPGLSDANNTAENDSFKLYARDIIPHHLRADLVTISSCYSAGQRAYSGEGLVGLSWAFVGAGAHNVIGALWEASDASTQQLMNKFYDELDKGVGPDVALRAAKLSLLRESKFSNPFYWAPFQLYSGS